MEKKAKQVIASMFLVFLILAIVTVVVLHVTTPTTVTFLPGVPTPDQTTTKAVKTFTTSQTHKPNHMMLAGYDHYDEYHLEIPF